MSTNPYLQHLNTEDPQLVQPSKRKRIRLSVAVDAPGGNKKTISLSTRPGQSLVGNYRNYYNYRVEDERLAVLPEHIFTHKRVLDIGCNAGLLSLQIARTCRPTSVLGVDIDPFLVGRARRNLRMMRASARADGTLDYFPPACMEQFGVGLGVQGMGVLSNVEFQCSDWVHEPLLDEDPQGEDVHEDDLQEKEEERAGGGQDLEIASAQPTLAKDKGSYDVILALSITKWIHLNNGDGGLRHFFHKIHASLGKGGLLILEPQAWDGYARRAGLSEEMRENYYGIEFYPTSFVRFLCAKVGFRVRETKEPGHADKGFRRKLYVLEKL